MITKTKRVLYTYLLFISIICMLYFFTYKELASAGEERGNIPGNNINSGEVVKKGNWDYFIKLEDKNYSIYKYNSINKKKYKIIKEPIIYNLNIIGDWIYFINTGTIYKVKTNGQGLRSISNSKYDEVNEMVIQGGWIYYSNWLDNQSLYKIKTDGTGKKKIATTKGGVGEINVQGEWVYFTNGNGNGYYKVKTDGSSLNKIINDDKWFYRPIVHGEWVYFVMDDGIYRQKTDGSSLNCLKNFISNHYRADVSINVYGDWVYYEIDDNREGYLSDNPLIGKMKLDGSEPKNIISFEASEDVSYSEIYIAGEWLYYNRWERGKGTFLFRVKTNGTLNQKV